MPSSILRLQLWLCGVFAQARVLADAEEFAEALELAALIPASQVLPGDGWGLASCVSFPFVCWSAARSVAAQCAASPIHT